jgi:hypothetical protein
LEDVEDPTALFKRLTDIGEPVSFKLYLALLRRNFYYFSLQYSFLLEAEHYILFL